MKSTYETSRRCSGSRNIAKFRAVPEISGDFARQYLENDNSYQKVAE